MSRFGEQIQSRTKHDLHQVSDALTQVADAIDDQDRFHAQESSSDILVGEVQRICHYLGLKLPKSAPTGGSVNDMLDRLVGPLGVMRRRVALKDKWWKNGDGPLLAVVRDTGDVCALIPGLLSGYYYYDRASKDYVRVDDSNQGRFEEKAVCFYMPLPDRPLSGRDLVSFIWSNIRVGDRLMACLPILLAVLLGLLTPYLTRVVFARFIPTGKHVFMISTALLLASLALGRYLLDTVKTGFLSCISIRIDSLLGNALIGRTLNLPARFFSDKNTGELAKTVASLSSLPNILAEAFFSVGVTLLCSLLYVAQIAVIAPPLAWPTVIAVVLLILLSAVCLYQKIRQVNQQLDVDTATQGLVHALFTGMHRIKLSGSENRAFSKWAKLYEKKVRGTYRPPFPSFMQGEMNIAIQMVGLLLAFAVGSRSNISQAQFAAFSVAYGMLMTAFNNVSASSDTIASLGPILKKGEPILRAVPENSPNRRPVDKLDGAIELNNVTFSYVDGGPRIMDHMNLKIRPGEYVAIVGRSSCGKSTLLRLLLGFETPGEGTIDYDGSDLATLDLASVRRRVGTVLQRGKLFAGDIFTNITASAPWLTEEEAWEIARMVGLEEEIKSMSEGMNTIIYEGSGCVSSGQRQRLMIARALAPKPDILILDEATSALDSIARKRVFDTLKALDCTRIVITQYPTAIRECDRILVLDSGRIVEEGAYDELVAKNGCFADLVRRQRVEREA